MAQSGTRFGWAWVAAPVLALASCSSLVTNQVDEKQKQGGLRHDGAAGSGGSGTDGAAVDAGSTGSGGAPTGGGYAGMGGIPWECFGGGLSCGGGVVYQGFYGPSSDDNCRRPAYTCPYGCNPDWHWRDAASPICAPPPAGCDDAGHCVDAGTTPGSEPSDAGAADAARE